MKIAPGGRLPMNSEDAASYGGIATLVRGDEVDVRRWRGPGWIRDLIGYCDRGGWQVRTISTPRTIYRDLQGTRADTSTPARPVRGGEGQPRDQLSVPELILLGREGRIDLLHSHRR